VLAGIPVSGFMPIDRRDELGRLPPSIAASLTACPDRGPRPAVRATIASAGGVLLVVPNAATPAKFVAISAVLAAIRAARCRSFIADGATNLDEVVRWTRTIPELEGQTRIMVTGPRGTRWPDGEALGKRLVTAIAMSR
jgi:hypothetical protein